jgi:hypothetical protein
MINRYEQIRSMRIIAAAGRQYRVLTPVAPRIQMPGNKAKQDAGPDAFSRENLPRTCMAGRVPVRVKKKRQGRQVQKG